MPAQPGSSKPAFFPGQKEAGADLFRDGGIFDQLLAGRPNVGEQLAVNRGTELIGQQAERRGLAGSGIELDAQRQFQQGVARESGANFEERLLRFLQPPGTTSIGGTPGAMAQILGKG